MFELLTNSTTRTVFVLLKVQFGRWCLARLPEGLFKPMKYHLSYFLKLGIQWGSIISICYFGSYKSLCNNIFSVALSSFPLKTISAEWQHQPWLEGPTKWQRFSWEQQAGGEQWAVKTINLNYSATNLSVKYQVEQNQPGKYRILPAVSCHSVNKSKLISFLTR